MRREALAALTVLMLATAGCIASPQELEAASTALDSPLLDSLMAYESPLSYAGDAIVLRTNVTSEGGTAAFWWEIPEGVILGDDDDTWVQFLAAPVLLEEDQAHLERWMLMAFLAEGGKLSLNSLAFGAPFSISMEGPLMGGSEDVERSLEPFLFSIGGELRAGGRVGFVVSGVAAEDVEMALVLLPLEEEWENDDALPDDTEEFLDAIAPRSRVALPLSGTGGMHQLAFYFHGGGFGFGSQTVATGPVNIEGETTNVLVGNRRSMTVSAEFPSGGYAVAATGYDAQSSTGMWEAVADAHGAVSEADGTLVAYLGPALTGWPFVLAMGEGDVPSRTEMTLETASMLGDGLFLIQVDLDTTLSELLGLPALPIKGMTGETRVERDGSDLSFVADGVRIRGVGLAQV